MEDADESPDGLRAFLSNVLPMVVRAKASSVERKRGVSQMLQRIGQAPFLVRAQVKPRFWAQITRQFVDNFLVNMERNRRSLPAEKELKLLSLLADHTGTTSVAERTALKAVLKTATMALNMVSEKVYKLFMADKINSDMFMSQVEKILLIVLKKPGCRRILTGGPDGNVQELVIVLLRLLLPPDELQSVDVASYNDSQRTMRRYLCADVLRLLLHAAPGDYQMANADVQDLVDLAGSPIMRLPARDHDHSVLACLTLVAEQAPLRFMTAAICDGANPPTALVFDNVLRTLAEVNEVQHPRLRESIRFVRAYLDASATANQGAGGLGSLVDGDILSRHGHARLRRMLFTMLAQPHSFHTQSSPLLLDHAGHNYLILCAELMLRTASLKAMLFAPGPHTDCRNSNTDGALLGADARTSTSRHSQPPHDVFPLHGLVLNLKYQILRELGIMSSNNHEQKKHSCSTRFSAVGNSRRSPPRQSDGDSTFVGSPANKSGLGATNSADEEPRFVWFKHSASPLLNCLQLATIFVEQLHSHERAISRHVSADHLGGGSCTQTSNSLALCSFIAFSSTLSELYCLATDTFVALGDVSPTAQESLVACKLWSTVLVQKITTLVGPMASINAPKLPFDLETIVHTQCKRVGRVLCHSLQAQLWGQDRSSMLLFGALLGLLGSLYVGTVRQISSCICLGIHIPVTDTGIELFGTGMNANYLNTSRQCLPQATKIF